MATIFTLHNSQGKLGVCDATCYNAKGPKCSCICGGLNHGKGLQQAAAQTIQADASIIAQAEAMHPALRPMTLRHGPNLWDHAHPTLFDLADKQHADVQKETC